MNSRKDKQMASSSTQCYKSIGILGGTYKGKDEAYLHAAKKLGTTLAERNIQIVYGGGNTGLMGVVAVTADDKGTPVLGIVPRFFRNICGPTLGQEIHVWSLPERITMMYHSSDAFIALPGGLNALEEISCVASWSSLTTDKKPVGLLNINGFFDGLLSFLDNAVEKGFMFKMARDNIVSAASIEELLDLLQAFHYHLGTSLSTFESSKRKRETDDNGVDITLCLRS